MRGFFKSKGTCNVYAKFLSRFSNNTTNKSLVTNVENPTNLQYSVDPSLSKGVDYFEKLSKHKFLLPIYDLVPRIGHCWIAPNATIVGEVLIGDYTSVWHNVVIRGDINQVKISKFCSIGDRTVIHTANSLPTGTAAVVHLGVHVIIQPGCSLYSCIIEDECFIGANTVIMEGSRVEKGAIVLPNSVVPPGRLIPAGQVWGGNPVQYIRDARDSEIFAHYTFTLEIFSLSETYLAQFTPWGYNYLKKEASREDVDLTPDQINNFPAKRQVNKPKLYYDYCI